MIYDSKDYGGSTEKVEGETTVKNNRYFGNYFLQPESYEKEALVLELKKKRSISLKLKS